MGHDTVYAYKRTSMDVSRHCLLYKVKLRSLHAEDNVNNAIFLAKYSHLPHRVNWNSYKSTAF